MINKNNWKLVRKYLEYRLRVDQLSDGSYRKEDVYTRYLLAWAGDKPFIKAPTFRPTLPEYLRTARLDGSKRKLSPGYVKKVLATARRFFSWLVDTQTGYKSLKYSWIVTIKAKRLPDIPKQRDAVSTEEIYRIACAPVENLVEERIRAAAVFLYLSGMRIGAFVSLPLLAVDIENRRVIQYPNMGVRTKNGKYAVTTFLPIPGLLQVVMDWDSKVRAILEPEGYWFAPLSPDTKEIDITAYEIGLNRGDLARKNLKAWMDKVGLKYHSPHKFRHGHIQFGLAHSTSHADYKAVSMNVMHSNIQITDQFYSNISDSEIHSRISSLGK
ncbi:MAG: tyrosine-type recombinase/integrase [Anaerolineales bacterium]|nr:tyrosine-type recombinase/integrase [Anaerolineales bacterium]